MGSSTAPGLAPSRDIDGTRVAFRKCKQRRRPEVNAISRLHGPARTCPCQRFAAVLAGRPTHDSGSKWLAIPSSYGFFLHGISPVCAGALALAHGRVWNVLVRSWDACTACTVPFTAVPRSPCPRSSSRSGAQAKRTGSSTRWRSSPPHCNGEGEPRKHPKAKEDAEPSASAFRRAPEPTGTAG